MSKIIICATYYLFLQYYNYCTILFYRPNCYCLISVKVKVSFSAVSSIKRIWKWQSVSVTWGQKLMDASQHSIVSSRAADLHTSVNNHSPEAEVQKLCAWQSCSCLHVIELVRDVCEYLKCSQHLNKNHERWNSIMGLNFVDICIHTNITRGHPWTLHELANTFRSNIDLLLFQIVQRFFKLVAICIMLLPQSIEGFILTKCRLWMAK